MAAAVAVATGAVGCAPVPLGNRNTYHNQSEGMGPTLHVNDIVAGTKNVGTLRRGDIIVFEGPPGAVPTKGLRLISGRRTRLRSAQPAEGRHSQRRQL